MTTREIYEKIKSVSNDELDALNMSTERDTTNKMTVFALYYEYPSGREHYRLLKYISGYLDLKYKSIDFLRLPSPQGLPAGRQGSEEPSRACEASSAKPKSIYSPWGWGN